MIRKLRERFYAKHIDISNIDEMLVRLGYLTKPLASVRFGKETENQKGKLKQLFYMINIHTETLRWFILFLMSIIFDDTDKVIFQKKLLGDFGFSIGGTPSFIQLMIALFMAVCSYYSVIFYLGEHYNKAEKYLCWLDPILVVKSEMPLKNSCLSKEAKKHLLKIWRFTLPLRVCALEFLGVSIGLFLASIMSTGYDWNEPLEVLLLIVYVPKYIVSIDFAANTMITMMIYLAMISESFRLKFREIGKEITELSRSSQESKNLIRNQLFFGKYLSEFNLACVTLKKYDFVIKDLVFMEYGFSVAFICLPLYHIFNVEAVWMVQAALVLICCFSVPFLLAGVFLFAAVSAEVRKLLLKIHSFAVHSLDSRMKRKVY